MEEEFPQTHTLKVPLHFGSISIKPQSLSPVQVYPWLTTLAFTFSFLFYVRYLCFPKFWELHVFLSYAASIPF